MTRAEAIPKLTEHKYKANDEFVLLHKIQMLSAETYEYLVRGRIPQGARYAVEKIADATCDLYACVRNGVKQQYEYDYYPLENMSDQQIRSLKNQCRDKAYRKLYTALDLANIVTIRWELLLGIPKGERGAEYVRKLPHFSQKRQKVFTDIREINALLKGYLKILKA